MASALDIKHSDELSSDHTPVIINFCTKYETVTPSYKILSKKTDLNTFAYWLDEGIDCNVPLKSAAQLDEAVEKFTNLIHDAAYRSTPTSAPSTHRKNNVVTSAEIRDLIDYKRKLRRIWQITKHPADKKKFNDACKKVKLRLADMKSDALGSFLEGLGTKKTDDNSLWQATKYLKRPVKRNVPFKDDNGQWCKSDKEKADAYALYLEKTFQPFSFNSAPETVLEYLNSPNKQERPIKKIVLSEVKNEIKKLNNKKAPGFDKVDATVLKSLPEKGVRFITILYNSILRLAHFPSQWKCAEIIPVLKPNKPEHMVSSYRPISLISTFSKVFERILLRRILHILEHDQIIPDHQFGFRHRHSTLEQGHRVVKVITEALEKKKYCCGVFLDIKQAFDKVWHEGLFYKLKLYLPAAYYKILRAYLMNRHYYVKVKTYNTKLFKILSGVPQGSVLGPTLYTLYTADLPFTNNVTTATFADDTAFLSASESPMEASSNIQATLDEVELWLNKWNIKVNNEKSVKVTFTLRKGDCPEVSLYGINIPKKQSAKYLGLRLDKRLNWREHIADKRRQLNNKTKRMYWLLGSKSKLSLDNKVLLYKAILKPVWTYGIQLWGTACKSNVDILQRYQSKTLRMISGAPWYMTNKDIHKDLKIPFVMDEIVKFSEQHLYRLSHHTNVLAITLLDESEEIKRLKRFHVSDLPFRSN